MTKDELYARLPQILKRLFTLGIGSAVLFLVIWYMGGHNLWGHFLTFCFKVTAFYYPISFSPGDAESAAFIREVVVSGQTTQLTFPINRLNSAMVEVVTLLAMWPYKKVRDFFRMAAWCLLFTILYQTFNVVIQLYDTEIGPDLANRFQLYWESSTWYAIVHKITNFDTFILRYWAGFPIFGCAIAADTWLRSGGRTREGSTSKR